MAAVLLDEYEVGSELVVAIDADDIMTVQLHARGLDVSGAVHAVVHRFQNEAVFALADIAVLCYDKIAQRCVNGKVNIGLTWNPPTSSPPSHVAGYRYPRSGKSFGSDPTAKHPTTQWRPIGAIQTSAAIRAEIPPPTFPGR